MQLNTQNIKTWLNQLILLTEVKQPNWDDIDFFAITTKDKIAEEDLSTAIFWYIKNPHLYGAQSIIIVLTQTLVTRADLLNSKKLKIEIDKFLNMTKCHTADPRFKLEREMLIKFLETSKNDKKI